MSNSHEEAISSSFILPMPIWGPLRAIARLCAGLSWSFGCYFLLLALSVFYIFSPEKTRMRKKILARRWIRGVATILGLRITTYGHVPEKPYFLVNNHITWLDFLAMNSLLDA